MTQKQANELPLGLYKLYYVGNEGWSLASVGYNEKGDHWFAPTNWITVPSYKWEIVECVIPIQLRTYA